MGWEMNLSSVVRYSLQDLRASANVQISQLLEMYDITGETFCMPLGTQCSVT